MKLIKFELFAIILAFLVFCGKTDRNIEHQGEELEEMISLTEWTDFIEIFIELPHIEADVEKDVIFHLTNLHNFSPVQAGSLLVTFENNQSKVEFTAPHPSKEGIFIIPIKISQVNLYDLNIIYKNSEFSEKFVFKNLDLFGHTQDHNHEEITIEKSKDNTVEHQHEETENFSETITFLKEQQWKSHFRTSLVTKQTIKASTSAIAHVEPYQHGYSEIVSPVEGFINIKHNQDMVIPGQKVRAGDELVHLCPPVGKANSWAERRLNYERAKKNFERAKNLLDRESISRREFEEIQQLYLIEKAAFETLLSAFGENAVSLDSNSMHFPLTASISGVVAEISVIPGQTVSSGQKLMTIIDPSKVWLRVDVSEKDYFKFKDPQGASIYIPGIDEPVEIQEQDLILLSKSDIVNPVNRTIPFLFQVQNRDHLLKIGQFFPISIYSSSKEKKLAVPQTAILDEEINKIVFIQKSGEEFEKRIVKTGATYLDWVEILEGLSEGERIVSQGAYFLKLAATVTAVGHAHVH